MQLLKHFLLPAFTVVCFPMNAQIITKGQPQPETKVEDATARQRRTPSDGLDEFTFYLGAGYVIADRTLEPNKAPFGKPPGMREDEIPTGTWSFSFGVRNRINSWSSYDVGLAFDRTGEAYDFKDTESDSTYSYKTTYSYLTMPIRFLLTTGDDVRVFFGPGIQPGLFSSYRQEIKYTSAENRTGSEKIDRADHINNFTLGVTATAGAQFRLSTGMSAYLTATVLRNLTSTYDNQAAFIHKATTFTISAGLAFHIADK